MRKKFIAIYSVLVVAIVLLAAFVPSCTPTTGTIEVKATLCGVPWQGAVNYTLTLSGGTSPVSGTVVPTTHSSMDAGTWTCAYVAGGPAGAFLNNPAASQTLVAGGTITFTFDFELNQDAAIELLHLPWTVNGIPIQGPPYYYELGAVCNIIDTHFLQWVLGCPGYNVTLNETSWLNITQTGGPGPVQIFVVNAGCAVNKTPTTQGLTPVKKSQVPSFNGNPVGQGMNITLTPLVPTTLDVKTVWQLVKCLNYTKAINWFGISLGGPQEPGHECVLFELVLPLPGQVYTFTLQTSASVALVDDVDGKPENNDTGWSAPLTLTVMVPG